MPTTQKCHDCGNVFSLVQLDYCPKDKHLLCKRCIRGHDCTAKRQAAEPAPKQFDPDALIGATETEKPASEAQAAFEIVSRESVPAGYVHAADPDVVAMLERLRAMKKGEAMRCKLPTENRARVNRKAKIKSFLTRAKFKFASSSDLDFLYLWPK